MLKFTSDGTSVDRAIARELQHACACARARNHFESPNSSAAVVLQSAVSASRARGTGRIAALPGFSVLDRTVRACGMIVPVGTLKIGRVAPRVSETSSELLSPQPQEPDRFLQVDCVISMFIIWLSILHPFTKPCCNPYAFATKRLSPHRRGASEPSQRSAAMTVSGNTTACWLRAWLPELAGQAYRSGATTESLRIGASNLTDPSSLHCLLSSRWRISSFACSTFRPSVCKVPTRSSRASLVHFTSICESSCRTQMVSRHTHTHTTASRETNQRTRSTRNRVETGGAHATRVSSDLSSRIRVESRLLVAHSRPLAAAAVRDCAGWPVVSNLCAGVRAVLRSVSEHMFNLVQSSGASFQVVCGVPYTALPIATVMSVSHSVPMVMRRKEAKGYGLKKIIEGVWKQGDTCLVVEDLVTSGISVFETIAPVEEAGLRVRDVVVLINREQGGRENIEKRGVKLHALVTVTEVMEILFKKGKIDAGTVEKVRRFVREAQMEISAAGAAGAGAGEAMLSPSALVASPLPAQPAPTRPSYASRISHAANPAARMLLELMVSKCSNLCLSADVTTKSELLRLANECGPSIVCLKTHVDILVDFDAGVVQELQRLAKLHRFLLFEDRKYADIGSTVGHQYGGGVYRTASWSPIVNAHIISGPGIIDGIRSEALKAEAAERAKGSEPLPRGLLLIAQMSSAGALATGEYTAAAVAMAAAHKPFVMGFIAQRRVSDDLGMIHMSPGVQLPPASAAAAMAKDASGAGAGAAPAAAASASSSASASTAAPSGKVSTGGDSLGQQYHSPSSLLGGADGTDVIIVGRAIINAPDPAQEARRYQAAGWEAYLAAVEK